MRVALVSFVAMFFMMVGTAQAVDGVLEINETCAENTGCFDGDSAGWPVTITKSGSYRLTGNLYTGNAAATAISISNHRVTLDLNGFEIACQPSPFPCIVFGGGGYGVYAASQSGITVRNGRIARLQENGVVAGARARIEDLEVFNMGGQSDSGIIVGDESIVRNNMVSDSGGTGISVGQYGLVQGNTVLRNGSWGISASFNSTVKENVVAENGSYGILTSASALIVNNNVHDNTAGGVTAQGGATLLGNTVHDNTGPGFNLNSMAGYGNNVLTANNGNIFGSNTNPEVLGGQQIETNICGSDTVCP